MSKSGLKEGVVTVLSRHTTTAVTINEAEPRLMDDIRQVGGAGAPQRGGEGSWCCHETSASEQSHASKLTAGPGGAAEAGRHGVRKPLEA